MNELISKVRYKISTSTDKILPITTDKYQFEVNIKNDNISKFLSRYVNNIEIHFSYIGKEVYKYKDKPDKVILVNESDIKKPNEELILKPFIYSIENFESYQRTYTKFLIDRMCNKLIKNNLYMNSTCPISNLVHQWEMETVQEIIEYLKEITE